MNTQINPLSDNDFIRQFENQTLDKIHFNHLGHLRLSWLYLQSYGVEQAIVKISYGIKAYAESLGASTKFNQTITDAIVRIMAKRMSFMSEQEWPLFLQDNSDIVDDSFSVLCQYYTKDILESDLARTSLIAPDIQPI